MDYSRWVICQDSSEVKLMNIQTIYLPKFFDTMNSRQNKMHSVFEDEVSNEAWTTDKSPKWHKKMSDWYTFNKSYILEKKKS